ACQRPEIRRRLCPMPRDHHRAEPDEHRGDRDQPGQREAGRHRSPTVVTAPGHRPPPAHAPPPPRPAAAPATTVYARTPRPRSTLPPAVSRSRPPAAPPAPPPSWPARNPRGPPIGPPPVP